MRASPWLSDSQGAAGREAVAAAASVPAPGACCVPSGCNSWPARQSAVCVCCTDGNSGPTCAAAIYGGHTALRLCFPGCARPLAGSNRGWAGLHSGRTPATVIPCPGGAWGLFRRPSPRVQNLFRPFSPVALLQVVIHPPETNKVRRDESNPGRSGPAGQDMAARAATRSGSCPESHLAGLGWPSYLGGGPRLAAHQRNVTTASRAGRVVPLYTRSCTPDVARNGAAIGCHCSVTINRALRRRHVKMHPCPSLNSVTRQQS